MIKTAEDHESLKTGLANVRDTVNSLIDSGFLIIKGKKVKVKFYLEGDYKVSSKSSIGGRYTIGRREKWPEKVGRRKKSGRKCREEGENEMLVVERYR